MSPPDRRTAYRLDRMATYGLCELCGGPRTPCWDVHKSEDRLDVSMASMCVDCGWGDPTYRPDWHMTNPQVTPGNA